MIHDFAGPYYISIDDFAFGETHKYVKLDLEGVSPEKFDQAILAADEIYKKRMGNGAALKALTLFVRLDPGLKQSLFQQTKGYQQH